MSMMVNGHRFGGGFTGSPYLATVGTLADNASSPSAVNVPYPAGLQANDIGFLQAVIINALDSDSVVTPPGWTLVSQDNIIFGSYWHALFWKRLVGNESGTVNITVTGGHSGADTFAGVISLWRGCVTSGTPYEALANNSGQSTDMAGNPVTADGPRRTFANFCAIDDDTLSSPAASWTEQYDLTTTSGSSDGGLKCYSIEQPVAGSLSAVVHTLAASERWQVKTLAIIKAALDVTETYGRVPAGDMNSGSDFRVPAGDMDSGGDIRNGQDIT